MNIIDINAKLIKGIFFETVYSNVGTTRLKRYCEYYSYLEGFPVIEEISKGSYQLITLRENYEYYKRYKPETIFKANLKTFKNDNERFLELLKQLCDGKARSDFSDKYIIVQTLLCSMTEKEISNAINISLSEIKKYTIKDDEYREHLKKAIDVGARTTMVAVVSYLKRSPFIKEKARAYILKFVLFNQDGLLRLTKSKWDIAKVILDGIQTKYVQLNEKQQVQLFHEIIRDGWTVLIDHFSSRCDQLLKQSKKPYEHMTGILINDSEINLSINLQMNVSETTNNYLS